MRSSGNLIDSGNLKDGRNPSGDGIRSQEERRIYLIRAMQQEMPQYRGIAIPAAEEEQKKLLRALMNVRPPIAPQQGFLDVQDAYLGEEIRKRGIVDCETLSPTAFDQRIYLWQGDITRLKADAIVNAANSALLGCFVPGHSCIDNVIHSFSGVQLRLACSEIIQELGREEETGSAKITPGFNLPCKYVLHTVGPIITGPLRPEDCELLAGCYRSCLELASAHGVESVAFCCISTGVFQFPQEEAAQIAVNTVSGFLSQNRSLRQVIFNVFTDRDLRIYRKLLG